MNRSHRDRNRNRHATVGDNEAPVPAKSSAKHVILYAGVGFLIGALVKPRVVCDGRMFRGSKQREMDDLDE